MHCSNKTRRPILFIACDSIHLIKVWLTPVNWYHFLGPMIWIYICMDNKKENYLSRVHLDNWHCSNYIARLVMKKYNWGKQCNWFYWLATKNIMETQISILSFYKNHRQQFGGPTIDIFPFFLYVGVIRSVIFAQRRWAKSQGSTIGAV